MPTIVAAEQLWHHVHVIAEIDAVRPRAKRLLHVHPLRAADALRLAAALVAGDDDPGAMES